MVFFIEKQHLTKIKRIELNVVANARLYICNLLFIEPSKKKKTTKSCRFCKVNIKVLSIKYKLINYLNNITMQFIKSERRFLKNTSTIPTYFLSDKIKSYIKEDLNFMPENVYVSNAAGDYVFISIVKDNDVYTLTDSFYLEAQMKDFGIKPY
ncbi:MAG: hypothetical protein WCO04_01480 [Pseudomonadota bacterium]|jgi:hypothetical protein